MTTPNQQPEVSAEAREAAYQMLPLISRPRLDRDAVLFNDGKAEEIIQRAINRATEKLRHEARYFEVQASMQCVLIRCTKHINICQQNKNEITGAECGGCIAEEREIARAERDQLRAENIELRAQLEKQDRLEGITIDQRDRAEEAADELASTILGEDIDWSDHGAKWIEAINNAESIHALRAENEALQAKLNSPEIDDFFKGVPMEAAHQRERWGESHDKSKSGEQWAFLFGVLAGKAIQARKSGDTDKAKHHAITAAAALANMHALYSTAAMAKGEAK